MPADNLHGEGLVSSHSFGPLRSGQRSIGSNQHVDATSDSGLSSNQSRSFEGEHHLMNRRRAHAEVPLQVSFSGRPSEHVRVCIDEGQILLLRRCLPLTTRKQANQYLLRRFTDQASRAGNASGNIHANPPTSMKSSDSVFKPFSDVRGSRWTRLGITGVRLPSPPASARLTAELRLARQPNLNKF